MEYLKTGLKTVLGAQQGSQLPTGAETVERLVERVQTSTLLEDRRDACRALKSLSKKFRLEVGAHAMDALIKTLETDRQDPEIMSYALEALSNVISGPPEDDDFFEEQDDSEDIGKQFTEIFIKRPENAAVLIDLIMETDFRVRWPSVKLLTGLLIHRSKEVQEYILASPVGISRLMDLLKDNREIIRNDTLLLLAHLTRNNANIQKIVVFENAFDKLFEILKNEGYSDGGVVVEDCLVVLLHLLKNNLSNQNFLKEGSYIQHIAPFFMIQGEPSQWSSQKIGNIHIMLKIVRTLVSPNNPIQAVSSCQKMMNQCGLLENICSILMASGIPADILTETIIAVAEIIRGHHGNQEYFASVNAPSTPPRAAIVVLLMSLMNEKQPFILRCSVLYCFQCFLFKNELGQAQIVQTMLPSSADISTVTPGQLLCGGLFSSDPVTNWFASVALSHALVDNSTQKEQLLRVQLATNVGTPPVSLIKQCTAVLQQGNKVHTRLGLLMLLCCWLSQCNLAVTHFLSVPTNIPFLTSQVGLTEGDEHEDLVQGLCAFLLGICIKFNDDSVPSFTNNDLCQIIEKRIGRQMFLDKLDLIAKQESYATALQGPQLRYNCPVDMFFDYEFCMLFKSLEDDIEKCVQPKSLSSLNGPESSMTPEQHGLLKHFKDIIREQDYQINHLKQQFEHLKVDHVKTEKEVQEMSSTVFQLRDQNSLLKARKNLTSNSQDSLGASSAKELESVKAELQSLKEEYKLNELKLKEKSEEINKLQSHSADVDLSLQANREALEKSSAEQRLIVQEMRQRICNLEEEFRKLKEDINKQKDLEEEIKGIKQKNNTALEELDALQKEQEDLLIKLTEQGTEMNRYKMKLKELGDNVEEDEDDEFSEGIESCDEIET